MYYAIIIGDSLNRPMTTAEVYFTAFMVLWVMSPVIAGLGSCLAKLALAKMKALVT